MWRRGLFISVCHGHAGAALLHFTCRGYQGVVQSLRWQGQLYLLLGQVGAGLLPCCFADGFGFLSGHKLFLTYIPSFLKAMNLLLVQPHL